MENIESVETTQESEVIEDDVIVSEDTESDEETEPFVLDDVPSSENGASDIPVAVSDGDAPVAVSDGDASVVVSDGDVPVAVSDGDAPVFMSVVYSVSPPDVVPLWESDIADYGVTDGLLLLILVALVFQTLLLRKR